MYKTYNNLLYQIVIPFRPNIHPIELEKSFDSKIKVHFCLHYNQDKLCEPYSFNPFITKLESTSIIEIKLKELKVLEQKEYSLNRNLIIILLEYINSFIDIIRYSHYKNNGIGKIHIRNIGINDILQSTIKVNGKIKSYFHKVSFHEKSEEKSFEIKKIEDEIPYSWSSLNKALDLLELGYYNESLIVGFNLLDYCVQETLKRNMQNLTNEERNFIIRRIETQRLETYLGVLLKLTTGRNIYNNSLTEKELKRLNNFRNNIIHAGQQSTYHETSQHLQTIYKIIKSLNNFNMNYELQERLILI